MKPLNEIKSKKVNLVLTPYDYSLLNKIRINHKKSISQLIRDAIIFYGIYYSMPIEETTNTVL